MKNNPKYINKTVDVAVIGSGMGSLSAACLLAKSGQQVLVLEQNYLPGGCTSAYYRQGYIFEAGATTLVGLDPHMSLRHVVDELGISLGAVPLDVPMQVHLADGDVLTRWRDLDRWIGEAERVFGPHNQRPFWEHCFRVSNFVWETSLMQRVFPPSRLRDFWPIIKGFRPRQLAFAGLAFRSMKHLMARYGLLGNRAFVAFVDEQLLITAQNTHEAVNVLFGATALCYTNFGNYYMPGGLIHLVRPFIDFLEKNGGELQLRTAVTQVEPNKNGYLLHTEKGTVQCKTLLSGVPLNNTLELYPAEHLRRKYRHKVLGSEKLNSALQVGIGFRQNGPPESCLHHQIHLPEPLPQTGSKSIFLSLSHPDDVFRAPRGHAVASVSTHVSDPAARAQLDKAAATETILNVLEAKGFLRRDDIAHLHTATPTTWADWTKRKFGFVGGYPQFFRTKPWQMVDSRLDGRGAYLCGDTTYPGQGIPGVCLSGIIAFEKIKLDQK